MNSELGEWVDGEWVDGEWEYAESMYTLNTAQLKSENFDLTDSLFMQYGLYVKLDVRKDLFRR